MRAVLTRIRAVPLTSAGLVAAVLGVVSYVVGWQLGLIELFVLAVACGLALILALPFIVGRMRIDISREITSSKVVAGEPATAVVTVRNTRRPVVVHDSVDKRPVRIEVPALGSGEENPTFFKLPTEHRGVVKVGPALLSRRDPLHLMRRDRIQIDQEELWVHPRHDLVAPLPVGFAKDLEGPTSDASPAGDVAFHALRDYEPGDDFRHIHWMSTARLQKPVVRHYVDNRKPQLLVLIDNRADVLTSDRPGASDPTVNPVASAAGDKAGSSGSLLDGAVEAAASLAVSSILRQEPIAVWTVGGPLYGSSKPGSHEDLLDRLTLLKPAEQGDPAQAALLGIRNESGISAVVLFTGPLPAEDLLPFTREVRRHARPIIGRVWPQDEVIPGMVPGAKVIDFDTLAGFTRAWGGVR